MVRVKAAGLNPIDNHLVSGLMASMLPHEYPLTLGGAPPTVSDVLPN